MKVLSFGEILLRLASPGSGKLNKSGYEYVAREICKRFGCKKVAITLRESMDTSVMKSAVTKRWTTKQ